MRTLRFAITLLLWLYAPSLAQQLRLTDVLVAPFPTKPNLIANSSFEEASPEGLPAGWNWSPRNTDATLRLVPDRARTGQRSLFITNSTPFGAHVYGMAEYLAPIPLQAGKQYTLSAYVYSPEPGVAWLGGGGSWQFRMRLPRSLNGWRRVSMTFTPGDDDVPFRLRLITESPTTGIWIDDIKLEEGETATPYTDSAHSSPTLQCEPIRPVSETQGDGAFAVPFTLALPRDAEVTLRATLGRGVQVTQQVRLTAGFYLIAVHGEATGIAPLPRQLVLEAKTNAERVSGEVTIRFYSRAEALRLLNTVKKRLPAYERAIAEMQRAGTPTQWAKVSLTILQNFVRYVEEDLNHKVTAPDGSETYPELRRALMQLQELHEVEVHLQHELRNPSAPAQLWRCRGQRPKVVNGSLVDETGKPLFFTGYGHFGQVRSDIEKFPAYGINIVQIELGPSAVFPSEGAVNEVPVRELQSVLERAEKANVAVNLLISPHYFPDWALQKWQHLRKRRNGFLQYCLHAPESQNLLRQYIRTLIPAISRYPALHSICLSNEPVSFEEPCEYATRDWHHWLKLRHGDIATLNRRWNAQYTRFEDIPLPNPFDGNARNHLPSWYDYIRFNQEFLAGWHQMLADAIHEVAPDLPVHAKVMTWTLVNDVDVVYGADAFLVSQFSDINGNDSVCWYNHNEGEYAQGWVLNAMSHDLQRSMKNAPVFNSENHLIPDREKRSVPAQHVHTVLWQEAIYGQCATTIWVWERTFDPRSDFAGSIMHRPACAEAVGRVNLLLNRYAQEVTALQRAPADVALIDSVTGKVWDGGAHTDCLGKLYEALTFTGVKVGFISERQLEEGVLPPAPVLFVTNQQHLSDRALEALQRYRGRIVFVGGSGLLSLNEYGLPVATHIAPGAQIPFVYGKTSVPDLWHSLLTSLSTWGVKARVKVTDTEGKPVWGVAWRTAEVDGKTVINLCNYRKDAVRIRLQVNGYPASYRAPDANTWRKGIIDLRSLETKLLVVRAQTGKEGMKN